METIASSPMTQLLLGDRPARALAKALRLQHRAPRGGAAWFAHIGKRATAAMATSAKQGTTKTRHHENGRPESPLGDGEGARDRDRSAPFAAHKSL